MTFKSYVINVVKTCTSFIVTDASMAEIPRPAIYGAYHHIELAEPTKEVTSEKKTYDVVGPVCESGDFIGKARLLYSTLALYQHMRLCSKASKTVFLEIRIDTWINHTKDV